MEAITAAGCALLNLREDAELSAPGTWSAGRRGPFRLGPVEVQRKRVPYFSWEAGNLDIIEQVTVDPSREGWEEFG